MAGSSTSQYAVMLGGPGVDGGIDGSGEPATVWRQAQALARVEPTGIGAAFLDDPSTVLDLVARTGADVALVRLEWARIEPRRGEKSDEAIALYRSVLNGLSARGVRPGVVLSDGTLPAWLGPEGWLTPSASEHFVDYARLVIDELGGLVSQVITFEEPALFAWAGWMVGVAPPFRLAAPRDALFALDAMLNADRLVRRTLVDIVAATASSILSSPGRLGSLEWVVQGRSSSTPSVSNRVVDALLGPRVEGRLRPGALDEGAVPPGGCVVAGGPGPLPTRSRSSVLWRPVETSSESVSAGDVATAIRHDAMVRGRGATSVRFRHVCVVIDERGRRTRLPLHRRIDELTSTLAGCEEARKDGVELPLVVLGELTDRWRFGSFRSREGLIGVDRTRGKSGFEIMATDASSVEVLEPLHALLEKHRLAV